MKKKRPINKDLDEMRSDMDALGEIFGAGEYPAVQARPGKIRATKRKTGKNTGGRAKSMLRSGGKDRQ